MESKEVFICYRGSDATAIGVGTEIYAELEPSRNIPCFFAPRTIPKGKDFKALLPSVFKSIKVVVLLLTKDFFTRCSENDDIVYEELKQALMNKQIKFLPIVFPNFNYKSENLSCFTEDEINRFKHISAFEYSTPYAFDCPKIIETICKLKESTLSFDSNVLHAQKEITINRNKLVILSGRQITYQDIESAVNLDTQIYNSEFYISPETCWEWFKVNPDIYFMLKEQVTGKIIAYINIAPITDECYKKIFDGEFNTVGITKNMILDYNMPSAYRVYFFSVVISSEYQNTSAFKILFDAIVEKFIEFAEHDIFLKEMIADAVTDQGEHFCKLFGMHKIVSSNHNSNIYEIKLIPPKFKIISSKVKKLYDLYLKKYKDEPYLFDS